MVESTRIMRASHLADEAMASDISPHRRVKKSEVTPVLTRQPSLIYLLCAGQFVYALLIVARFLTTPRVYICTRVRAARAARLLCRCPTAAKEFFPLHGEAFTPHHLPPMPNLL